jgi:membrane-bound lytic murein transglycosylase D
MEPDVPDSRKIFVKAGKRDTAVSIAKRYKVTAAQVRTWNNMKNDTLALGQRVELHVPNRAAGKPVRTAAAKPGTRPAAKPAAKGKPQNSQLAKKSSKPIQKTASKPAKPAGKTTVAAASAKPVR